MPLRNGVFFGIDLFIHEDEQSCKAVISVNDGCFCIDSITLNFRIECRIDNNHMYNNIEVYSRTCLDNIGCFNLNMSGVFVIPQSLHCAHRWVRIRPPFHNNNVDEIVRGIKQIWDENGCYTDEQRIFVCSRCDRVRLLVDDEELRKKSSEFIPNNILKEIFGEINLNFGMVTCVLLDMNRSVFKFIECYIEKNNMKMIAAGFCISSWLYPEYFHTNNRVFWSKIDTFPCYFSSSLRDPDSRADSFARKSTLLIGYNGIIRLNMGKYNKMVVDLFKSSLMSIEDYKSFYGPFYSTIFDDIQSLACNLRARKIAFISSTSRGGDITLMRQAHMRFYKLIGIDASWYVTIPVNSVSKITKYKLHNITQNVAPKSAKLHKHEIIDFENWTKMNVDRLWRSNMFKTADIVVLDDLQMTGFVRYLREINPEVKIIFRSHTYIHGKLYGQNTAFTNVWNYIAHNLTDIDLFVAQPTNDLMAHFQTHPIAYLPSSIDPLDGLNKTIAENDRAYYEQIFREHCHECTHKHFSFSSPYIIQVSSFDRSKGQKECIDAFHILFNMISSRINDKNDVLYGLYLLIVGYGSIDDPETTTIFNELQQYLGEEHNSAIKDRVMIVKIPPIDQILNILIKDARVALQLSRSEGFENKITDCIMKSVPVVVFNVGGLRLQVLDKRTGYIIDAGDVQHVAQKVLYLLDNESFRDGMLEYKDYSYMFSTPFNIYGWLYIFNMLAEGSTRTKENVLKGIVRKYFGKYEHEFLSKIEQHSRTCNDR